MIYFHVIYDLKEIYGFDIAYDRGINFLTGRISAVTFMFVAGISCTLSRNNVRRGLRILALAMLITVVTCLYGPDFAIIFGILHFMGTAMIMYPLFKRLNVWMVAALATGLILISNVTGKIVANNDWLFILGITSPEFSSADYYPLIPWLGVFLYGTVFGRVVYGNKKSIFSFSLPDNIISMAGRHTLFIYMIHQPVAIAVLEIVTRILR